MKNNITVDEQIKVWAYRTVQPVDVLIGRLYETSQPPVLGSAAAVELPIKGLSFADVYSRVSTMESGSVARIDPQPHFASFLAIEVGPLGFRG